MRGPSGTDRGRAVRPPAKKSHTMLLAAGGGGLLLILIVGVAVGMNSGNGGKPKKDNGTSKNGNSGTQHSNASTTEPPHDVTSRDLPRSKEVPKIQAELAQLTEVFPADVTALNDTELKTIEDQWQLLIDKIRSEEYQGYPSTVKRKDLGNAQPLWQKLREERQRREELPKE